MVAAGPSRAQARSRPARRAWGDDIAVTDAAGGARRDDVAVAASLGPPASNNPIRTWEIGYSPDGGSAAGIAWLSRRTMRGRRRLNDPALGAPGRPLHGGQATPDARTAGRTSSCPAGGTRSTGAAHDRGPSGAHPANAAAGTRNTACPAAAAGEAASAAAGAHLPEEAALADQTTHEQQASGFWRDRHVPLSNSSYRIASIRAADKWIPETIGNNLSRLDGAAVALRAGELATDLVAAVSSPPPRPQPRPSPASNSRRASFRCLRRKSRGRGALE